MNFIVAFIIKVTLIVACTGIILWATRTRSAAARHSVWASVIVVMLLLPLLILWGPRARTPIPAFLRAPVDSLVRASNSIEPAERDSPIPAGTENGSRERNSRESWIRIVEGVYLVGVFALLTRLVIGTISARRLATRSQSQNGFLTSSSCATPITLGAFHPVTIMPESWQDWSSQQLDMVLAHEREHALRRDPLIRWLALLNRAVFWFHPLSWWIERHLSFLAEQACDDAVLAGGHDPRGYSEHLLEMQRLMIRSGKRISYVGSAMPGSFLSKRIERIVDGSPMFRTSRKRVAFAIAATLSASGYLAAAAIGRPSFREAQAVIPSAQAKWAGTWKLDKSKSNTGLEPRIQSMMDSIESVTVKLEPESDGVIVKFDLIGIQPVMRQQSQFALKFGVPTNGKEISPIFAMAYPATVTMVPALNNVLRLTITYLDGSGSQTLSFEVSSDGNTMTEFLPPPENFQFVFERQ